MCPQIKQIQRFCQEKDKALSMQECRTAVSHSSITAWENTVWNQRAPDAAHSQSLPQRGSCILLLFGKLCSAGIAKRRKHLPILANYELADARHLDSLAQAEMEEGLWLMNVATWQEHQSTRQRAQSRRQHRVTSASCCHMHWSADALMLSKKWKHLSGQETRQVTSLPRTNSNSKGKQIHHWLVKTTWEQPQN